MHLTRIIILLLLAAPLAAQTTTVTELSDVTLKSNGTTVYSSTAAAGTVLEIKITPRPTPTPTTEIRVEPVLLDFGPAEMGAPRTIKRVTVTNVSNRSIQVRNQDIQGARDFSIDRYLNAVLLPGRQAYLDIAFRPLLAGLRVATVRVLWDKGSQDVQITAQVGTVTPPDPPDPPDPPIPPDPPVPVPGEGFFVAPNGSASNAGTAASPLVTGERC